MRTLVQRLYSSSFRSRFSRSHSSYNGQKGSQRLTDDEGSRLSQKRTVTSTAEGARKSQRSLDIGGLSGVQKSWFSGTKGSRNDSEVRGSMEEEMVPVGKITVRHDLEWSNSPLDRPSPNL